MTDRELLENAAKAAGLMIHEARQAERDVLIGPDKAGLCIVSVSTWWNPLTDDGDALRLAVKLELEIYNGDHEAGTSVHVGYAHDPDSDSMIRYCIEPHGTDPYAATRRAIVRAAATIGKEMA